MEGKLRLSEQELKLVHEAMGIYMTVANIEIGRHKMYKETSMNRLFEKMEAYANAGVVWVKIAKAMGIPQETIAEFLEKADR